MTRNRLLQAAFAVILMGATPAFAQQGTPAEAKAMLEKALTAVKADKAKAIADINKGGEFLKGDLYVYCFNLSDGLIVANPSNNAKQFLNTDVRLLKDVKGKVYGPELYAAGQKDQISEPVVYMFPRPGADATPHEKSAYVSKAGTDMGCGVGYYK